jgi:predicted RNase H-like HicB family nuclease
MNQTFTAIVRKEDNLYVAECSETGTASQGETIETALENLKEATELYLEEFPLKSSPPLPLQASSFQELTANLREWLKE